MIPEMSFIDACPDTARIFGYMDTRANYQLLTDNILDLSHADYLHPGSLGGMMTGAKTSVSEKYGAITVEWLSDNCTPPPAFYSMVPPPSKGDIWTRVTWRAPAVMVLETGANVAGTPRNPEHEATTLHNMTPADSVSSHYFFCTVRKFNQLDAGFNTMLGQLITQAFLNEDKPMLEKQQASMGGVDFWDLKPLLLKIDAPAVRARRSLRNAIDAERARSGTVVDPSPRPDTPQDV
jgi:vanillate O-demethylase monooxygenase subunit